MPTAVNPAAPPPITIMSYAKGMLLTGLAHAAGARPSIADN